jgi:hypothetical protein
MIDSPENTWRWKTTFRSLGGTCHNRALSISQPRHPPAPPSYEEIQFRFPSWVRRGQGHGRKSCWTHPLEFPLTKGDTCEVRPKPNFSQLPSSKIDSAFPSVVVPPRHVISSSLLFGLLTILLLETLCLAQVSSSENPPSRGAALELRGVSLGHPSGTSLSAPFKGGITPFSSLGEPRSSRGSSTIDPYELRTDVVVSRSSRSLL